MAYRAESSRFESGRRIPRNTVTTVELKNGHITTFYMKWGNDSHSVLHSHLGQENKNNSKEILPAKISEDIPIPRWAQLKMKRLQERKYSSKQPWRSLGGGGLEYFCHLLAHCIQQLLCCSFHLETLHWLANKSVFDRCMRKLQKWWISLTVRFPQRINADVTTSERKVIILKRGLSVNILGLSRVGSKQCHYWLNGS